MRGAALPAALLCAILGMTLSYAPARARITAIGAAILAAGAIVAIGLPAAWREMAFAACWLILIVVALSIHLPHPLRPGFYLALGLAAGCGAGAVITVEGVPADLIRALPLTATVVPGRWLVRRRWGIALKVATSWTIAVALLALLLPASTATPGYKPDHMD